MFLRHANAWPVKTQKHVCKFKFNINTHGNSLAKLLLRVSITSTSTTFGVATSWADLSLLHHWHGILPYPEHQAWIQMTHLYGSVHVYGELWKFRLYFSFKFVLGVSWMEESAVQYQKLREVRGLTCLCEILKLLPWLVRQKSGFFSQTFSLCSQMILASNHEVLTLFATVEVKSCIVAGRFSHERHHYSQDT